MNKLPGYFFLLFLFSCTPAPKHQESKSAIPLLKSHQIFAPAELLEDFRILITTLKEAHPDLYRVTSEADINKRIQTIEQAIQQPLSYLEFLKQIALLFNDIGCINTQWGHSQAFLDFRNDSIKLFPLQIQIRNNRFFVKNNNSADSTIGNGWEILEFNGERPGKYLQKNYVLLPVDGKIKTLQKRWLEMAFPNHHANFWEQPDTFYLKLKNTAGKIYERPVATLLKSEFKQNEIIEKQIQEPLMFSINHDIAILTLQSFNKRRIENAGQGFELFIDSCFKEIKKKELKELIINLRGPGWGDISCGATLLSYLTTEPFTYIEEIKPASDTNFTYREFITAIAQPDTAELLLLQKEIPPKPAAFTGNLYLITDGWDVDAKGFFCAKIKGRPNSTFAGEECGATIFGVNGYPLSLKLPHTGIQVWIPTVQMVTDRKSYGAVHGVEVDLPLPDMKDPVSQIIKLLGK